MKVADLESISLEAEAAEVGSERRDDGLHPKPVAELGSIARVLPALKAWKMQDLRGHGKQSRSGNCGRVRVPVKRP